MAAAVRPVHFRTERPDLECVVSRVVGFRAIDTPRWAGPFRRSYIAARDDARAYNRKGRQ